MNTYDPRLVSDLDQWLRTRNHAEQQIVRLVQELRRPPAGVEKPCPWSVIGQALNMTKQAAQQKFAPKITDEP